MNFCILVIRIFVVNPFLRNPGGKLIWLSTGKFSTGTC